MGRQNKDEKKDEEKRKKGRERVQRHRGSKVDIFSANGFHNAPQYVRWLKNADRNEAPGDAAEDSMGGGSTRRRVAKTVKKVVGAVKKRLPSRRQSSRERSEGQQRALKGMNFVPSSELELVV